MIQENVCLKSKQLSAATGSFRDNDYTGKMVGGFTCFENLLHHLPVTCAVILVE